MLRSQLRDLSDFDDMPEHFVGANLEQNLNLMPKETFVYDEIPATELEKLLDKIDFYNELDVGISLDHFTRTQALKTFVPVATYHDED